MDNIKKSLIKLFNKFIKGLDDNFNKITYILVCVLTITTMLCINNDNRGKSIIIYIISVLPLLIVNYLQKDIKKSKNGFPVVNKRYTKKLDDEMIIITKNDWPDAILYLYEIENYLGK